jgi:hypothetical protein
MQASGGNPSNFSTICWMGTLKFFLAEQVKNCRVPSFDVVTNTALPPAGSDLQDPW